MLNRNDVEYKLNTKKDEIFIIVPEAIFKDDRLTASEKMTYSIIEGLASLNSYKEAYPGTKYLAKQLNLSVRQIQLIINELQKHSLISIRTSGRKRFFKPLKFHNDAYAIITSDVIKNTSMSNPYKLSYGRITALGWNNQFSGHDYGSIKEMADDLCVSESTVYRYIRVWQSKLLVSRDKNSRLKFIPLNKFSVANQKEIKRAEAEFERLKGEMANKQLDPEGKQIIRNIYNQMR